MEMDKRTNNDLQNTTQKTKVRSTRISLKTNSVNIDHQLQFQTFFL